MKRRSHMFYLMATIPLLLVVGYPVESNVADEWRIRVVDVDGKAVSGVVVRQFWQHYSLEGNSHEEERLTDSSGRVVFPRRTIRASLIWRLMGPAWKVMQLGVHASFGPSSDAIAFTEGYEGSGRWEGKDSTIVLKPVRYPSR